MILKENIPLSSVTTFRIGGPANYFTTARSVADLKEASEFARGKVMPLLILGGGSNILVSDDGFPGLVVKMEIGGIAVLESGILSAGAGVNWDELVAYAVEHGFHGLENLSRIPGTVGAAPVQNIGAYGSEVKDVIAFVEAFDRESGELKMLSREECQFGYRMSLFKKPEGKKYIVTRVGFALTKDGKLDASYKDVEAYFAAHPELPLNVKNLRAAIIAVRTAKLPDLAVFGTAGSFFKNPVVSKETFAELKNTYPDIPSYPADDAVKIPAGWLIDHVAGLKGFRDGDVGIYERQALVIVNFGKGSAADVKKLAAKIISAIKEKTGIVLEPEVEIIG